MATNYIALAVPAFLAGIGVELVVAGRRGNAPAERWAKAWGPTQSRDGDSLALEFGAPGAALVEAADGHGDLSVQPSDELENQPLGSTWLEAQHHLQDATAASAPHGATQPRDR